MHKRQLGCLALILALLTLIPNSHAQVATGFPPYSTIDGAHFDKINLANLNVHLDVPIIGKPGRGLGFHYALHFDSSIWYEAPQGPGQLPEWQVVDNGFGWRQHTEALTGYVTYELSACNRSQSFGNWVYVDPAGTAHSFDNAWVGSVCNGNPPTTSSYGKATDGSGYHLFVTSAPSATVYPPSGGSIAPPVSEGSFDFVGGIAPVQPHTTGPAQITDANGNFISSSDGLSFTDTTGANVLTIGNSYSTYTYQAPGGSKSVSVGYTTYNIQTNFGCSGITEYGPNTGGSPASLITSITYPDGSSYQFAYEDTPGYSGYKTGRLSQITLPTGGTISYSYWGGDTGRGVFCVDGSSAGMTRTVNDGSSSFQQDYSVSGSATHVKTYSGATYDETVINFSGIYETLRQVYQGPASGGTPLETIETCWNGVSSSTCGAGANVTPPIANRIKYTTLGGTTSRHDEYYDGTGLGLLTETDDLDWGYAYLGKTQITYATNLGNIVNKPASVVSYDASGNVVSQTNYSYDDYSVYGLVQTGSYSPLPPQHRDPPQSQRGNLTSISQWVSGSTYLAKQFTYFDTGVLSTTIDVNGAVTRYNLPNPDPGNTTCGFTFPTSVTPPTGTSGVDLTSKSTWDCNGGVATSTTDPNNRIVATTSWDPNFWRPTAVTDQTMGYTQLFSYTPTTTDTHWGINSTSTVHSKTTLDSLGRVHVSQQEQGYNSPNFDSVETDYDSYGRPSRTTTAYVGTAGQTNSSASATTTTYDALGRPLHVQDAGGGTIDYSYYNNDVLITAGSPNTQRQYEYDALGRLTSVCEITSAAGSGTCGQAQTQTGYWTKYSYDGAGRLLTVTQNAQAPVAQQQTRSFTYDGLGRMLSENNPETGGTTYTYDSYSSSNSCNVTNIGDLAAKRDAAGNTICYMFDALHRLYIIGYYDGPAQNTTPAKFFIYDAATVNGQTMQNAKGHLARAYTMYRPYTSVSTDEGFSYSPRGEVKDVYQSTPHSSGFYHLSATYWSHGPMQNLSIPGVPTITYGASDSSGLDVEGRITKVMASSGINPVPGATINTADPSTSSEPLGALLSLNLGTSTSGQYDSDTFTYDPHTGRMHTYQFNVNGQSDTGTLTWNANSSLQQLQIADNITGTTDSQTCNYAHDDLGRVSSVNCGSLWSQTFSYDPFGNITKAGSLNFNPGYDTTKNQFVTNPFSSTYDVNGNLTWDLVHNYAWDAEGHSITVDNNLITYDALGRMVEQNRNGVYTQIVYGPGGGKQALMNGQTLTKAFVPLLGGVTAVYNPSGLQYYRHSDHLGSSRLASTPARAKYYSGAYAPFGESYAETGTTDRSFTGNNEDTVPGLADFMFREYSSAQQGRWISPDPAGLGAANPTDPQSWNRYAYLGNRPLANVDPLGFDGFDCTLSYSPNGGGETYDTQSTCYNDLYGTLEGVPGWGIASLGLTLAGGIGGGGDGGGISGLDEQWTSINPQSFGAGAYDSMSAYQSYSASMGGGAPPADTGLGIRAPGQSYSDCLSQHAEDYSLAGFLGVQDSRNADFFIGNDVSSILFGDRSDGLLGLGLIHGGLEGMAIGIGEQLTYGRRTGSEIISLNLRVFGGTKSPSGPALRALGGRSKTGLEIFGEVLSGIAEIKLAADVGFTGAEMIGCAFHQ